jgi:hypothetical protein
MYGVLTNVPTCYREEIVGHSFENCKINITFLNLTFRGPCIVIYSYNKSQRDALFLKFILIKTLYVSDRFTVHHQESQHCIHSNRYLSC